MNTTPAIDLIEFIVAVVSIRTQVVQKALLSPQPLISAPMLTPRDLV